MEPDIYTVFHSHNFFFDTVSASLIINFFPPYFEDCKNFQTKIFSISKLNADWTNILTRKCVLRFCQLFLSKQCVYASIVRKCFFFFSVTNDKFSSIVVTPCFAIRFNDIRQYFITQFKIQMFSINFVPTSMIENFSPGIV